MIGGRIVDSWIFFKIDAFVYKQLRRNLIRKDESDEKSVNGKF